MIRKWVIKHWYINEAMKAISAGLAAFASWHCYHGGGNPLVFISGIMFVACMVIICDVVTVLIRKAKGKPIYTTEDTP